MSAVSAAGQFSPAYRNYALIMLVICLAFNLVSAVLYLMSGRTIKDDLAAGRAMS